MKIYKDTFEIEYYLNKFNLTKHLNKELIDNCEIHTFKKGESICTLGHAVNYMYFLVKGKTKVSTLLSTGKSLLLCFTNPLEIIGDIEFIDNPFADCNVTALNECVCLAFPLDKIKQYAFNDPKFLRFIIESLGTKLRNNSIYSAINMLYPLENRFASYLLSLVSNDCEKRYTVEIESITLLSELLGTSYRHLNRVVSSLISQGVIKKSKNTILILNIEILKSLAQDIFLKKDFVFN